MKILSKLKEICKYFYHFGLKLGLVEIIQLFIIRNESTSLGKKIYKIKHQIIQKRIYNTNIDIINKYKKMNRKKNSKIKDNCYIFICWWQGIENMPTIVKICIKSILKKYDNNRVKIITKNNYTDFVNIPEHILLKYQKKYISIAHFSDILRMMLLDKYGGIWIDATIFLERPLNKQIYEYSFYTVHHCLYSEYHVCQGKWMTSFLASGKDNLMIKFILEMLLSYWKNENIAIDYFFLDDIIAIGYKNFDEFKKMIDDVPINNTNTDKLQGKLDLPYNESEWNELTKEDYIFKTTYKKEYKNSDGTYYNHLKKD